jgi:ribosome-associated translation inhibitor RaiA
MKDQQAEPTGGFVMKIVFKNLKNSDLVSRAVKDRFAPLLNKFPQLQGHRLTVTLEMENSPVKPGRDSFSAKVLVDGRKFRGLNLRRRSDNLYAALAEVTDGMLELLNRAGEKSRMRRRREQRRTVQWIREAA